MEHSVQRLAFDERGLLPPGDYQLTLDELADSVLVIGPPTTADPSEWDWEWRWQLVQNLGILVRQLWQVGIDRIFINGSFVEDKAHPNDIDGYFECELSHLASGRLETELNALEPDRIWTWHPASRTLAPNSTKRQLPMWHKYRVELYPECGLLSGIRDEFGNNQTFPAAFRKTRTLFLPKGIIQIVR